MFYNVPSRYSTKFGAGLYIIGGHLPCSLLPLSCAKGLSRLFIKITGLGKGEFFSSTSSFAVRYYQKSSFESGVGRVLGGAGPHQHALEQ
jgi:hypothetical protein